MKALTITLALLLSASLGAFGYHVYLTQNPKAGAQYVAAALEQARVNSDQQAVTTYVRHVATVIEAARIDAPKTTLPRDCIRGYTLNGYDATPVIQLARCVVTVDVDGKYKVEARSALGNEARFGPY